MSYSGFAGSLDIELGRSRILEGLLAAAHGGAAALMQTLPIPVVVRVLVIALLAFSLWHAIRRYGRLSDPAAITRLVLDAGNEWRVFFRDGTERKAGLLPSSYRHPALVVLNLKVTGYRFARTIILLPDNVDQALFRRLRVRLTLGAGLQSQEPGSRRSDFGR